MNHKCENFYKLQAENIQYTYSMKGGRGIKALVDINIKNIRSREICFILGPNGSGKSTFLNLLAGRLSMSPQNGRFKYLVNDVEDNLPDCRPFYIPQTPHLGVVENMTILENLVLRRSFSEKRRFQKAITKIVKKEIIHFLDIYHSKFLESKLYALPSELSGGQVQIVNFLSVLYSNPKILLMDEPTSKLDEKHRILFMSIIDKAMQNKNLMIICVTHDIDMVNRIGNRVIALDDGRLKKEELIRNIKEFRSPGEIRYLKDKTSLPENFKRSIDDWWKPLPNKIFTTSYFEGDDSLGGYLANQPLNREERTIRESNGIIRLLALKHANKSDRILDAPCGWGRHSIALRKQGYNIYGLDINLNFLNRATCDHELNNVPIFLNGNMMHLPISSSSFKYIINIWTSFGFFGDEYDFLVLKEFNRILMKNGKVLIHTDHNPRRVTEGIFDEPQVRKLSNHEKLEVIEYYCEKDRSVYGSWKLSKDTKSYPFKIRIYDEDEWILIARNSGFKKPSFFGSFDGQVELTAKSQEFIIILEKK